MNDLTQFKRGLEKKLKDRQLAEATFNFYNRTVEEIAMIIFMKHVSEETAEKSNLVYKHSFLFSNHTYFEHYYEELENKVIELEFFTCFKTSLNEHIDKILEVEEISEEERDSIYQKKAELFALFDRRQEVLKKEYTFLKMKKNKPLTFFVEICLCAFFVFSAALIIHKEHFAFFISLVSLLAFHFSIVKATGQHFEKVKFRRRMNQIFPSKIQKGINALSILYLVGLAIAVISSFAVLVSFFSYSQQEQSLLLQDYPIGFIILISILQLVSSLWFFYDGVYEKRYFLFKRFELKHSFEDKETFLEYVRPSKNIEKL